MSQLIVGLPQLVLVNDIRKKRLEAQLQKLNAQKITTLEQIATCNQQEVAKRQAYLDYKKNAFANLIKKNITQNHIIKIELALQSIIQEMEQIINERDALKEQLAKLNDEIKVLHNNIKKHIIKDEKYHFLGSEFNINLENKDK